MTSPSVSRCAGFAAIVALATAVPTAAHPLGNDNIEHASVLWLFPDRIEVDFLLFIAENPSARFEQDEMDTDKDEVASSDEQQAWLDLQARRYEAELLVRLDGQPLPLKAIEGTTDPKTGRRSSHRVIYEVPGFAGMPTYRVLIRYVGRFGLPLAAGPHTLDYEDTTYLSYPGLKRVVVERLPEIEYLAPLPEFWTEDPLKFEQYDPANLPQVRSAHVRFKVDAPATMPITPGAAPEAVSTRPSAQGLADVPDKYEDGLTGPVAGVQSTYQAQANRLMDLLRGRWGLMVFLTVTGLAFTWGAAHALMPGHAKTVVAAYLISQSGTYWHAVLLAIIVTITHTALVVILGVVWAFYQATNPAIGPKLQLWLGLISGLLVSGMGLTLIWRACRGALGHQHHHHHREHDHDKNRSWLRRLFTHSHPHPPALTDMHEHSHGRGHVHAHRHDHAHHHDHDEHGLAHHHHDHQHDHVHLHLDGGNRVAAGPASPDRVTGRMILLLGITGGIVPCPTATIIMLLGIGANVVMGALYAVAVFSLGLALTLMLIGFLALSSRRFAARLMSGEDRTDELSGGGRLILLRIVPAISGLAVVLLGAAIAANYAHYMRTGSALFTWMG